MRRETSDPPDLPDPPDPPDPSAEPPWDVRITVMPGPRGPTLRQRIAHIRIVRRAGVIAPLMMTTGAVGTMVVLALGGGHSSASNSMTALTHDPGALGVAAAYGYPPRCLSVTIPADHPSYARADFDRATLCGRYAGYPTAIFRRVDGAWRAVLDAISYSCPVASLPPTVQAELAVCP